MKYIVLSQTVSQYIGYSGSQVYDDVSSVQYVWLYPKHMKGPNRNECKSKNLKGSKKSGIDEQGSYHVWESNFLWPGGFAGFDSEGFAYSENFVDSEGFADPEGSVH